jgi:aspartyl-tRNA(Asn)/glutamyl-tRNA(Gln) amidotransferase subunit C
MASYIGLPSARHNAEQRPVHHDCVLPVAAGAGTQGAVAGRNPPLLIGRAAILTRLAMSVDADTVRRIAHLARIKVAEDEIEHLQGELNAILAFFEQLAEIDVDGVEPMTSVTPMQMKKRPDVVTDGGDAEAVLANAPASEDNFFLVPKVVE